MDTPSKIFGHRLRALIQRRGLTVGGFAKDMEISRATLYNWFERDDPPPSRRHRSEMVRLLGEPEDYVLRGQTPSRNIAHLKLGGKLDTVHEEPAVSSGGVASRIPEQRNPSTRADCESYARRLFDAAELSDDPNAFPVILHRLKKQFPLDEWESPEPKK